MAREMTPAEQAAMRSDGQASKLFAAILEPATIFTCQVNQAFASNDKIVSMTYNNPTGDYTDVLPGMLVLVGSTAGARDKGACRVRKAFTQFINDGTAYIGETSEIAWANDLWLTVVDDFRLHPKHVFSLDDHGIKIDYDVTYSSQHSAFAPVVVMGPHAVAWLVSGQAQIVFDASESWCLSAGAKTYAWTASAGSFDNASSATPTLTVEAWSNHVLVSCTVTVGGVSSSGHRYVFLFDDDHPPYGAQVVDDPQGDVGDGGWQFAVSLRDDLSAVQQNPLVVLFARDWYGGAEISYGPLAGRENVIAWGWASNENLLDDTHGGAVTLNVKGPHWWMQKMYFPVGVELNDSVNSPADWKTMQSLTVDKAIFHLLHWRSTASLCIDVILSGDTRQAPSLTTQPESLWGQMEEIGWKKIWARPCCDRYGRLFVEVDAQMLDDTGRGDIPVVTTVEKGDWRGELEITRRVTGEVAQIDLSTIAHSNGESGTLYSLAPGHILKGHGSVRIGDNYLAASQIESNMMAGLMLARELIPYEFRIQAGANQRLVDICPRQYIALDVAASDTPRGLAYTGNAVVREVSLSLEESGFLGASWEAEAASEFVIGINGDIPREDGSSDEISGTPNLGNLDFPNLPLDLGGWDGEAEYDTAPTKAAMLVISPTRSISYTKNFNSLKEGAPTWYSMNFGLTTDDLTKIAWFEVNRAGRCYLASDKKLWSAYLGEQWQLVHDFTDDPDDVLIWSMGINPTAADQVALVVGKMYPGEYAYVWMGTSAGISPVENELLYPPAFEGGDLTYGAGKWIFTHTQGVGGAGRLTRLGSNGGEELSIATVTSAIYHFHARAGTADRIIHFLAQTVYTNGGETETLLGDPVIKSDHPMCAALTPDGVRVMALGDDDIMRKSSDGGLTWSTLPTETLGVYASYGIAHCIDSNRWTIAHGFFGATLPKVWYSPDFGVNWTDKTGNLRDLAGVGFRPWRLKTVA